MNLYSEPYDPHAFHVDLTQTVLLRLDRQMLRISKPSQNVLKHGCFNDPTLAEDDPKMVGQSIYNLTNATVCLRPRRLARRRWFSRKYPICIKLSSEHNQPKVSNLRAEHLGAVPEVESDESDNDLHKTHKKPRRSTVSNPDQRQPKDYEVFTTDSNNDSEDGRKYVPPRSSSDGHLPFSGSDNYL